MTGAIRSTRTKAVPLLFFSTTNPTWNGLESKLVLRGERDLRSRNLWPIKAPTAENGNNPACSIGGGELLQQLSDH